VKVLLMQRKVFRAGNSIVVSLPKDALELLGISEGSVVTVELDREQQRLIITPSRREISGIDEDFARQVSEFIERYRPALEALAK
jgi:putative addiction module antidote